MADLRHAISPALIGRLVSTSMVRSTPSGLDGWAQSSSAVRRWSRCPAWRPAALACHCSAPLYPADTERTRLGHYVPPAHRQSHDQGLPKTDKYPTGAVQAHMLRDSKQSLGNVMAELFSITYLLESHNDAVVLERGVINRLWAVGPGITGQRFGALSLSGRWMHRVAGRPSC